MRYLVSLLVVGSCACSVSDEPIYIDRSCDTAHPCPEGLVCFSKACASQAPVDKVDSNPGSNPNADDDGDGLTNAEEAVLGTNPRDADTDHDYVDDKTESENQSDPLDPNKDGDKLIDGAEYWSGTDSNVFDTDGNGVQDGDEDADGDGYTNYEETSVACDPKNPAIHP